MVEALVHRVYMCIAGVHVAAIPTTSAVHVYGIMVNSKLASFGDMIASAT